MILNPAILALLLGSLLTAAFSVYASFLGLKIIAGWDLRSGSEKQLALERRTYLVSTILSHLLAFEIFSLFLFVYTADHIHPLFVGAMCAAGSLNVNEYGYPTLVVKMAAVVLSGVWLLINFADNQAEDYPLIRPKYRLLLWITALLVLETILQYAYFKGLRADVITSCCGTLFSEETDTIAGDITALPPTLTQILFFLGLVITLRIGIHFVWRKEGARWYGYASILMLLAALVAIISFISVYFYQLPTHHCPFCILQANYHLVGYPLYASLFTAVIFGAAVGALSPFSGLPTLGPLISDLQKKYCMISMAAYLALASIALWPMLWSDFKLSGY